MGMVRQIFACTADSAGAVQNKASRLRRRNAPLQVLRPFPRFRPLNGLYGRNPSGAHLHMADRHPPDRDQATAIPRPEPVITPPEGGSLTLHTDLLGDLQVPGSMGRPVELEALAARAAVYATRARGDGTRRVYRSAWRGYEAWCRSLGREALNGDPELLAMYATKRADDGVAVSTLRVDLAAIPHRPPARGHPRSTCAHPRLGHGRRRHHAGGRGTRPVRQAAPAVPDVLRQLLAACPPPSTALGARDRAMLLLGFGAALRRSELVALQLGDVVTVSGRGVCGCWCAARRPTSTAKARTSLSGPTRPTPCSARWLLWMAGSLSATERVTSTGRRPRVPGASGRSSAPSPRPGRPTGVGLSDKAVARLVKGTALRAGLDPERYSGHSLRAGLATAAGDAGAALPDLMRQTRHKSTQVALAYLRPADLWRNNVTQGVFATKDNGEGEG